MSEVPDTEAVRKQVRSQLEALSAPFIDDLVDAYFKYGSAVLAQAVFLHAAWREVIPPDDASWIDVAIRVSRENGGAGIGAVLERLTAVGATREDISMLVRHMQRETLLGLCSNIDNTPGLFDDPVNPKLHWHLALFEKCPPESMDLGGLHEVVEDFDPAGSE